MQRLVHSVLLVLPVLLVLFGMAGKKNDKKKT
jgi:hypothetical protein